MKMTLVLAGVVFIALVLGCAKKVRGKHCRETDRAAD